MRIPFLLAVLAALLPALDAPRLPLHVQGGRLLDASGNSALLRGINLSGLLFGDGNAASEAGYGNRPYGAWRPPAADAFPRIRGWGFNCVRLPLSWANLQPLSADRVDENYLRAVGGTLRDAADAGLSMVLSMHHSDWSSAYPHGGGMPAWVQPGQADPQAAEVAFLIDPAQRALYLSAWERILRHCAGAGDAGNAGIAAIDVWNEPRPARDPQARARALDGLEALYDEAAVRLPSVCPGVLLICQDLVDRRPALRHVPPGSLYSFHAYGPFQGERLASLVAKLDHAAELAAPPFIGEIGRKENPDWQSDAATLLARLRRSDVSWAWFGYDYYAHPLYGNLGEGPVDTGLLAVVRQGL